jgi:hypothetical protein
MDFKPFLKKFFLQHNKIYSISKDEVLEWILKETNFDLCQAYIYTFVKAVGMFAKPYGSKNCYELDWKIIEKKFGVKFKGVINE